MWCQGQDSNLRSPSGQRFYRPSVLATHPPWLVSGCRLTGASCLIDPSSNAPSARCLLEPEGGLAPSTSRLQIGCAAVAPLGHASGNSESCFARNKHRPPNMVPLLSIGMPPSLRQYRLSLSSLTVLCQAADTHAVPLLLEVYLAEVIIGDNES